MRGLLLVSLAALGGCTISGGSRIGLFSATAPVVAIIADDAFEGEAVGYMDRSGTIEMRSVTDPEVRCAGDFRYTGKRSGRGLIRCNDGSAAEINFNSISSVSGYGYGATNRGPVSFTYGLTPEDAIEYLRAPEGKAVRINNGRAQLYEL